MMRWSGDVIPWRSSTRIVTHLIGAQLWAALPAVLQSVRSRRNVRANAGWCELTASCRCGTSEITIAVELALHGQ